jgi:calcium permeable stress-gated cation channel
MDKIGLDAVTFLRFVRMFRWMFTSIAFMCCLTLAPINAVFNIRHIDPKSRDILSMLTIRDVRGFWLFAHVAMSYVTCGLVMGYVWYNWRAMARLRNDWFRSPEYMNSFYARTLMIQGVPKKYQSDNGIREIFESVQVPYPTTSVHIGRRVGDLPGLIKFHNDTVKELEAVLVRYLKDGVIPSKRPIIRIGGWMGCGGRKIDAIDFYTCVLSFSFFLFVRVCVFKRLILYW